MAFGNRSEDPWDTPPKRRQSPEPLADGEAAAGSPLDKLKGWNEARKAEKSRREAESLPPSLFCPLCGQEMAAGYLSGGRGVWWAPGQPNRRAKWIGPDPDTAIRVDNEGALFTYKTAWYCRPCGRVIFALTPPDAQTAGDLDMSPGRFAKDQDGTWAEASGPAEKENQE